MKTTAALLCAALASTALGAHDHRRRHVHQRNNHVKRAMVTVWETEYATVTEYYDSTTTLYITPGAESEEPEHTPTDGQFFEPELSSTTSTTSSASTTTTTQAPPPPPPPEQESPSPSPEPQPEPEPEPEPEPQPEPEPEPEPEEPEEPEQPEQPGSGSPPSDTHTGDLTYYDLGMGACGFDDSGLDYDEHIVAISKDVMGTQSNGNPYCDQTITIKAKGKTIQATVRDKCMGCAPENIDVSKGAFEALFGSLDLGRTTVEWWFN